MSHIVSVPVMIIEVGWRILGALGQNSIAHKDKGVPTQESIALEMV